MVLQQLQSSWRTLGKFRYYIPLKIKPGKFQTHKLLCRFGGGSKSPGGISQGRPLFQVALGPLVGLSHLGTVSGALCRGPSLRKLLEAGKDTLHVRENLGLELEDEAASSGP